MVFAVVEDNPSRQATNPAIERAPVAPHNRSRSISATISTTRPSMALRCPANSASSSKSTSRRSLGIIAVAAKDITPSSQPGPTYLGHQALQLDWSLSRFGVFTRVRLLVVLG